MPEPQGALTALPLAKPGPLSWTPLPRTLLNRLFLLVATIMVVSATAVVGFVVNAKRHEVVEEAQRDSVMLLEVVADAVHDSVVIGDYDAVRRSLRKAVSSSVFRSVEFFDLTGGRIVVGAQASSGWKPPEWLMSVVANDVTSANRSIVVGGVDYGVLRVHYDVERVASSLWHVMVIGALAWLVALLLILPVCRVLLKRWLAGLARLDNFYRSVVAGEPIPASAIDPDMPSEIQQVVALFRQTADLVLEREMGRRALDNQKFALDQHAIVSITDLSGAITYANDRFCAATGYRREDLIGQDHRILNSGLHDRRYFQDLWDTVAGGRVWHGEFCNRAKNGELFWVSTTIVPLLDTEGRPQQYIAIRTDVSNRVRAQRELAELNAALESKVAERTRDLESASQAAASANRAKSDFLSNMSHEMRTPLNAILGMTHLALRANPPPKIQQHLQTVSDSGQHLLELINDILDFSKIEAGKLELESVSFLLPEVIENVSTLLQPSASAKGIRLVTQLDPALLRPLRGDPLRLRQILLNYTSNAVKFSSSGHITIRAALRTSDPDGLFLRLAVTDQGIGLSADLAAHLFQPFQQADSSTTRRFGGTGLGLAICRELATLMGGTVGVDSVLGVGSTFWADVHLGWGVGQVPVAMSAPDSRQLEDRWTAALRGRRVLVVDDNEVNLLVAKELLESVEARVQVASSGAEALELVEHGAFDCLLMDMQMPDMDGLETTRRLRQISSLQDLPIIAMTANARLEDQLSCRAAGMNDFITKPVVPEALYAVVARWASNKPAAAPSVPAPRPSIGAGSPVLNLSRLLTVIGSDSQRLTPILQSFERLARRSTEELESAAARADTAALGALAHKLKGSAGMLGGEALSDSCEHLEAALAEPAVAPESVRLSAQRVQKDLSDLVMALNEVRERNSLVRRAPASVGD